MRISRSDGNFGNGLAQTNRTFNSSGNHKKLLMELSSLVITDFIFYELRIYKVLYFYRHFKEISHHDLSTLTLRL